MRVSGPNIPNIGSSSRFPGRKSAAEAQAPPQAQAPKTKDADGDGLSDDDETKTYRTDPNRKDTDRDGRDDGVEVKNGTNPRVPINLAANDAAAVAGRGRGRLYPWPDGKGYSRLQSIAASNGLVDTTECK
jgi:Bacterial TSP3 repeat